MGDKLKRRYAGVSDTVFHMSGVENTLRHMPRYNAYQCRGGVIGDTSYNRDKAKRDLKRLLDEEC